MKFKERHERMKYKTIEKKSGLGKTLFYPYSKVKYVWKQMHAYKETKDKTGYQREYCSFSTLQESKDHIIQNIKERKQIKESMAKIVRKEEQKRNKEKEEKANLKKRKKWKTVKVHNFVE